MELDDLPNKTRGATIALVGLIVILAGLAAMVTAGLTSIHTLNDAMDDSSFSCSPVSYTRLPNASAAQTTYNTIYGFTNTDIWAGGGSGSGAGIWHYAGTTWTQQTFANTGVQSVWGIASNDVWIGGTARMEHWDGATWTEYNPSNFATVSGLWGAATNDIYSAQANGRIGHWDGSTWTSVIVDSSAIFKDVFGFASNDIWAIGFSGGGLVAEAWHWNGAIWTESTMPNPTPDTYELMEAWGASSNDLWAAALTVSQNHGSLYHWDGTTWQITNRDANKQRTDIKGVSSTDIWSVGQRVLYHYDGTTWNTQIDFGTGSVIGSDNANTQRIWHADHQNLWVNAAGLTGGGFIIHIACNNTNLGGTTFGLQAPSQLWLTLTIITLLIGATIALITRPIEGAD